MVLSTYQKAVECRGTFEPRMSCASILDDMEATQAIEVFGPQSDPATTVGLPAVVEASKMFFGSSSVITAFANIDGS